MPPANIPDESHTVRALDDADRAKLRRQGQLIYVAVAIGGVGLFFAYLMVSMLRSGEWQGAAVVGAVCLLLAALCRLVWRIGGLVYLDLRTGKKERFATKIDGKRVRVHGPGSSAVYLLKIGDREDAVTEAEYHSFSPGDEVLVERAPKSRFLLYVRPLAEVDDAAVLAVRDNGG